MISAEEFREYNRGAAEIGDGAASAVEQRVLGWCRAHKDATVAEKREAAKLIMEGFVQAYDDKAAEFASQWYDYRAEQGGARLRQAVTMTVYEPESVDDVARYQAKKLAKEGDAAFARACGEFARNDAFRSLNETIIANVGRDRDKGAMFARVPTGFEPRRGLPHAQDGRRVQALPQELRLQGGPQLRGRPRSRAGAGGQAEGAARAVQAVQGDRRD